MLIDQKFYTSDGYILIRYNGKRAYHVSASALPENAEPIIRASTGYTGQLNWQFARWTGTYELSQTINTKEQKA